MAIPRADGGIPARVKKLEDTVRRIQLMPSVSQAAVAPLAVAKSSVWYDSTAGNEPSYWNGTTWVPVRDETIAVAQGTADVAQSTAVSAAADAAVAVAATGALQTDLDAAEAAVAAAQADVDTLTGTTIPGLAADIAAAQADVDAILPITTTEISDDAITTPKIAALAITAAKIAADTITASQIAANAITASELAANAVIAGKIAAGTIVAADIAAGTITTAKLAADAIDGMTITGALFRTAAAGQRIEIDSPAADNEVRFYSGVSGEAAPGIIEATASAGFGQVRLASPEFTSGIAELILQSHPTNITSFNATAGQVVINATESSADVLIASASGDIILAPTAGVGDVKVGTQRVAVSIQPTSSFSATANNGVTGTSFAAGTPVVGVVFVAPTTGSVWVNVQGHLEQTVASRFGYLAFEVRDGSILSSGTVVHAAVTQEGVGVGTGRIAASNRTLVTGLTPGSNYNARTMHVATPSGATVNVIYRSIVVEPVL